jgi:mono/diheme cytochrome c family protein
VPFVGFDPIWGIPVNTVAIGQKLRSPFFYLYRYPGSQRKAMKRMIAGVILVGMALPMFADDPAAHVKLPEGKGQRETARICSGCHAIDTVVTERHDRAEWQKLVDAMAARGADGTDEELRIVVDYLTKNFGPKESSGK